MDEPRLVPTGGSSLDLLLPNRRMVATLKRVNRAVRTWHGRVHPSIQVMMNALSSLSLPRLHVSCDCISQLLMIALSAVSLPGLHVTCDGLGITYSVQILRSIS